VHKIKIKYACNCMIFRCPTIYKIIADKIVSSEEKKESSGVVWRSRFKRDLQACAGAASGRVDRRDDQSR
jgi:hypothetical protein